MPIRSRLAAVALVAALVASPAAAADAWYLKAFGGAAFVRDASLGVDDPDFSYRYHYYPGFVLGAAVGREVSPRLSVEAEYSYHRARADVHGKLDDRSPQEPIFDTWRDGENVTANALMLNLLYSFDPVAGGTVRPYAGAGIGGAALDFGGDDTDPQFAWQLIAGASRDLGPQWRLYGEARWFKVEEGTLHLSGPFAGEDWQTGGFESFDLLFGATYRF